MEILDNLPYDRIYLENKNNISLDNIFQTSIEFDENKNVYKEVKEKLIDKELKEITNIYLQYLQDKDKIIKKEGFFKRIFNIENIYRNYKKQNEDNIFLPTNLYITLKNVLKNIPNHHLIINDFDLLRESGSALNGVHSPIISKKLENSDEKEDFDDYLRSYGSSDIFYETDFHFLKYLYNNILYKNENLNKLNGEVFKANNFIGNFGKENWTRTESGYQPIVEDFLNTSFFISKNLNWTKIKRI